MADHKHVQSQDPEEGKYLEVYHRAMALEDEDSVHEAIAKGGLAILKERLPYVLIAARWQQANKLRKEKRRQKLQRNIDAAELTHPSIWDPYDRAAQHETLKIIADALSTFPDEDILAIWEHMKGLPDEEIRAKWIDRGIGPARPTVEVVRKRRQRALKRLREIVKTRLAAQTEFSEE